jgi:glycosyltransferase involved in cell wall biosynthesis
VTNAPEPSYFDDIAVPHRVLESARPVVNDDVPDADIVLATFWKTAPWVAALLPRKGAKAILLQGYEVSPGDENPTTDATWRLPMDAAWRLPLRKIVVSKWLAGLARNHFGDSHVYLVPNSVDTNQFYAPPRGKQAVPTVGMLYTDSHVKGADVALASLNQVRRQINNLHVVTFGAQPVSAQLPLPAWCEFHYRPRQEEIRHLYEKCDVWLCGSRSEGFHLPPLEAMACRCPVVSTSVGGPIDIIENGRNGYLVPIGDAVALADRVVDVLTFGDAQWRAMSDAALATATHYTWDDAVDLLENALRDIVTPNIE